MTKATNENNKTKEITEETKTDLYVKVPNKWYDDLSIKNEEFTILILLYRNYLLYREGLTLCSINLLTTYLRYNTATNRNIIKTIKDILISLAEKKYIYGLYDICYKEISVEDIVSKDYLFYCKLIAPPDNNYFEIQDKEINLILEEIQGVNLNKFNLIRYFCACRRVAHCAEKFGYLTQSKLKGLVNDSSTVQRYNKLLQDNLHLIRYNNSYLTADRHYCTTFIGTWDDEASFTANLQAEVDRLGLIHTDKVVSNRKRSVKQRLNNAVIAEKDKEIAELKAQLESLQYKPKDNPTEECTDYDKVMDEILETSEKDELEAKPTQKESSLTKHMHSKKDSTDISSLINDYVKETSDVNPEANLVAKFLGDYSKLYNKEINEIADGSLSVFKFFQVLCNQKNYTEYIAFKNSELAIDNLM